MSEDKSASPPPPAHGGRRPHSDLAVRTVPADSATDCCVAQNSNTDLPQPNSDSVLAEDCNDSGHDVLPEGGDAGSNCFKRLPEHKQVGSDPFNVQLESFGSGVLLHDCIDVEPEQTVGDLRKKVMSSVVLPPRTRTVRLFVGHGGAELGDDAVPISNTAIAAEVESKSLVVFFVRCTSAPINSCHSQRCCHRFLLHGFTSVVSSTVC